MHSINPYLRAFYKSNLLQQCNPVNNHILLVPTTECLLTGRDRESNATYLEIAGSEDFLASHVLRIPDTQAQSETNVRESRGKAKQFNTINGRTVVIKESFVYSNKGFRNLNQAQILTDQLFYPDSLETNQWLIYYISRPLVGAYEPITITPATFSTIVNNVGSSANTTSTASQEGSTETPREMRKDIKSFNDVLNNFPMIARQMQSGLEKVSKDFQKSMNDWVPSTSSRRHSVSSRSSSGSTTLRSNGSAISPYANGQPKSPSSIATLRVDEEEDHMRRALEVAVTVAINLFQKVDKQQLSFLGSTTELTGPVVERLIERYVAEQLHDSFLFPRLCNSHKLEDVELESKVHGMQHIDVAQVGISIDGGRRGKDLLDSQITSGAEEFRKLGVAGSPQQMVEILLATQKLVTGQKYPGINSAQKDKKDNASSEKPPSQAMNADTLVSLLLVVVIRSQLRHLHARLSYMRNFVFVEDVESGEIGYALSTFEAVLSYLHTDSAGLRKASHRNKRLWQATKKGDIDGIKAVLEADATPEDLTGSLTPLHDGQHLGSPEEQSKEKKQEFGISIERKSASPRKHDPGGIAAEELGSESASLAHVFPFQAAVEPRKSKRVSMDLRSLSNSSEYSFISRTTTLDSNISAIEGDTSVETLAQTQDIDGDSILMMAIESRQAEALRYLLSLETFYPLSCIFDDTNKERTTLLSAAVQLNSHELTNILLERIFEARNESQIIHYLSCPDVRGRTVAHYLFNAQWLLSRIGDIVPWMQKDKIGQTPLFALCRSYDHEEYSDMVNMALGWAGHQQGDGQPLHLDDHVDAKGNTLLHAINDPAIASRLLQRCDTDPNAPNDKRFTPLMVASKYGRMDLVRVLFGDPRVDVMARESRGMTAVELAKDDEIRNRIDDMVLVSNVPASGGRVTAVVRSFFVEDASVRMIIKSATRNDNGTIGVTTCRRSLADFENLVKWLALEHPASWLPSIFNFRSPFQIASKPSRAVLQDIQVRLDNFLKIMLAHTTFSIHELLWEFILFPEIPTEMMADRSRKKAELRVENVREEYEPTDDVGDVTTFVEHARDSLRGVNHSTKSVLRRINSLRVGHSNLASTTSFLVTHFSTLPFLPQSHINALVRYSQTLPPYASDPLNTLHADFSALLSTILAILSSLSRPHALITHLSTLQKSIDRHASSLRRSDRWPSALGLLDEARKGVQADAMEKLENAKSGYRDAGCELRYTQQAVAGELAGWWDLHSRLGKRSLRALGEKMVVRERDRLERMRRAARGVVTEGEGKRERRVGWMNEGVVHADGEDEA